MDFVLPLVAILFAGTAAFAVSALVGILLARMAARESSSGPGRPPSPFEG